MAVHAYLRRGVIKPRPSKPSLEDSIPYWRTGISEEGRCPLRDVIKLSPSMWLLEDANEEYVLHLADGSKARGVVKGQGTSKFRCIDSDGRPRDV